jgi:hypothetical protein
MGFLDPEREGGPKGFIGFAISARMSPQLKAAVEKIAEENWEPCPSSSDDVIRECAEVDFVQWDAPQTGAIRAPFATLHFVYEQNKPSCSLTQ